jgi:hypothetical protein
MSKESKDLDFLIEVKLVHGYLDTFLHLNTPYALSSFSRCKAVFEPLNLGLIVECSTTVPLSLASLNTFFKKKLLFEQKI